jgi:hypothetical protein
VTRPAISQHLAVLRTVGLVHERRDGTRRFYRTRTEGLAGLRALLDELDGTPDPPVGRATGPSSRARRGEDGPGRGGDASRDG